MRIVRGRCDAGGRRAALARRPRRGHERRAAGRILVIGGGIAGQAVCEEVRAARRRRAADARLRRGAPRRTTACALAPAAPARRRATSCACARTSGTPTARVDAAARRARRRARSRRADARRSTTARELRFERAVLCTGSDPLLPPLPGIDLPGVARLPRPRGLRGDRCAAARDARHAVVIGGGLLGLEAAYALVAGSAARRTVVHLVDRLMERQLDAAAAALLLPAIAGARRRRAAGARRPRAIVAGADGASTRAALRRRHASSTADLVVVSIGIRPARRAWPRAAGLDVERGDRRRRPHGQLATRASLAVGECAAAPRRRPRDRRADPRAGRGRGADADRRRRAAYAGSVPTAKLKVMGVDLVDGRRTPRARARSSPPTRRRARYRKLSSTPTGARAGAVLLGDTRGARAAAGGGAHAREPVDDPLALLAEASAGDAPPTCPTRAQVCNCNGVCKGEIVGAIRDERARLDRRRSWRVTRAGAGCGSCKPLVDRAARASSAAARREEPAYLCPCRQQTREQLAALVRERELDVGLRADRRAAAPGATAAPASRGSPTSSPRSPSSRHREERHARFINDRVHANIQNDGTFSVVPRIRGGVTTPARAAPHRRRRRAARACRW